MVAVPAILILDNQKQGAIAVLTTAPNPNETKLNEKIYETECGSTSNAPVATNRIPIDKVVRG